MRKGSVVVVLVVVCLLALGALVTPGFAHGHKTGKTCPPSSHNPGGTPPNCGQAPPTTTTVPPSTTTTVPPSTTTTTTVAPQCPAVSGPVSGIIIGVAQTIGERPVEGILIEVACFLYDTLDL